jgi:hypothetical protein
MKTAELCTVLAQAINDVKSNAMTTDKAQALLGLANAMTRVRRLQMDYNRQKTATSKAIDGLDD